MKVGICYESWSCGFPTVAIPKRDASKEYSIGRLVNYQGLARRIVEMGMADDLVLLHLGDVEYRLKCPEFIEAIEEDDPRIEGRIRWNSS